MDIYSHKIVGWKIHEIESGELSTQNRDASEPISFNPGKLQEVKRDKLAA